ncbi:39S ribosomal protein L35, mitochondrial isoform X2 [Strongylocentrotus purpuratus]|uniref:Large ribosomal subunit protein bL35m n=1 Tax=Strongylocentrotus purpuratus TaxID=7668 RepID=A0A7M7SYR6_STRPU|nr:39S ribosomal protein L35, mitochondrial isoform X2 [Strongylocentrotus purpuratus]
MFYSASTSIFARLKKIHVNVTRGQSNKMAASMRVFAASLVPRIHLNLLSPASTPCRTRCIKQKNIHKAVAPALSSSPQTTPIRGVTSAPLYQPPALQQGSFRGDELSTICSRLTGLSLKAPAPGPDGRLIQTRSFSSLICSRYTGGFSNKKIANQKVVTSPVLAHQPHRTVVRYSISKGKKKTVHAVIDRFYRLDCGLWVRPQSGRAKKLWKKTPRRRYRLKQHVFCNKTQSKMLDRMTSGFWKKRRHYLDDPFEQYHERHFDVIPPGSKVKGQ